MPASTPTPPARDARRAPPAHPSRTGGRRFAGCSVYPCRQPRGAPQSQVAATAIAKPSRSPRITPTLASTSTRSSAAAAARSEKKPSAATGRSSIAGVQRRITAGALKPKEAAAPTAPSSDYAPPANSAAPTSADAAAAPPALRNLAPAAISPDERGESLRGAAAAGDLAAVNALLGSVTDVDARDRSGRTALMLAIMNGKHADVVDALLAHGAAVDAVAPGGVRPLQIARAKGNAKIIDSLLRAGAH